MSKRDRLDPRVVRTRQLLRAALIDLVPEQGFAAISVQDIADRATLNRATFYLHYGDKTDLLMDTFETLVAGAQPLPPEEGPLSPEQAPVSIARVFQHIAGHADFFRVMLAEESVPEFNAKVRAYVEEVGLKWLTLLQPDDRKVIVRREIAINFIGSAALGVIVWWLQNGMPYPAEYMASQLLTLTALGLHRSLGLETPLPPESG
jgi:AcrR family transcriptional regulator